MMKKFFIVGAAALVFCIGILAFVNVVQTKDAATTKMVSVNDSVSAEQEIRGIIEKYYEIANTKNRQDLKIFSQEISAPEYKFSSENGVLNKDRALDQFDTLKPELLSAEFDDLTIQVHGDTAIAKYRDVSKTRNIATIVTPLRFTNVWVKRDGKWLIVAEHSSRIASSEFVPTNPRLENLALR